MTAGQPRTIAVVGTWHQASVVSACLADMGHRVRGIGSDPVAIASLNAGRAPVYEPGLEEMLQRNLQAGRLRYITSYADGLAGVEFAFLCIDTPVGPEDESDLAPIDEAVEAMGANATGAFTLCVSAQVPIGTCDRIAQVIAERRPGYSIPVAYVPEFLRLGSAIETFRKADRFIIGAADLAVATRVAELYEPLGQPIRLTDTRSAEMAKHGSNAFLATSISFINQIGDLCEETGADVTEVAEMMKLDRRIGRYAFLGAGLGYAGGTLGREISSLRRIGERHGVHTGLLEAVERVNAQRVPGVVKRLKRIYPTLRDHRFAILGLTYKPGTSTLRRSAALQLIDLLLAEGATVAAFDPLARLDEGERLPPFDLHADVAGAAQGASALILLSPWKGIEEVDFGACARSMRHPVVLDTGNFLTPSRLEGAGFVYVGVGRSTKQENL